MSPRATGEASFIQGNLGASNNNFVAVVLEGSNLVHYFKDNLTPGNPWISTYTISTTASSAGCLIQSTLRAPGSPGNLEVVVLEGTNLVHYYRDNSNLAAPQASLWSRKPTATISTQAQSSASFIQVNLHPGPTPGNPPPGNFQLVVLENGTFVQYTRDNSQPPTYSWTLKSVAKVTNNVANGFSELGQACLIQTSNEGKLDQLDIMLLAENQAETLLVHYTQDNAFDPVGVWQSDEVVLQFPIGSFNDG